MATIGIICEYNPFHLGHTRQIDRIREQFGADCSIAGINKLHLEAATMTPAANPVKAR